MSADEELLEYPCDFPVKVMGVSGEEFREVSRAIIQRHFKVDAADISEQPSRNGRFISLTFTVRATDRPGLDALYADLSADKRVLMAL